MGIYTFLTTGQKPPYNVQLFAVVFGWLSFGWKGVVVLTPLSCVHWTTEHPKEDTRTRHVAQFYGINETDPSASLNKALLLEAETFVTDNSSRCDVYRGESTLQGAGEGVFVDGFCKRGSIVGVYGGTLYTHRAYLYASTEVGSYLSAAHSHFFGENLTEMRVNRTLSRYLYSVKGEKLCGYQYGGFSLSGLELPDCAPDNITLAQYINHPAKETTPNVAFFSLPSDFPTQKMPCGYALAPELSQPTVPIVVAVAMRDLKEEELFVDYGIDYGDKYSSRRPRWYKEVQPAHWVPEVEVEEKAELCELTSPAGNDEL